jgi:hypothetical protein
MKELAISAAERAGASFTPSPMNSTGVGSLFKVEAAKCHVK